MGKQTWRAGRHSPAAIKIDRSLSVDGETGEAVDRQQATAGKRPDVMVPLLQLQSSPRLQLQQLQSNNNTSQGQSVCLHGHKRS